jgi:UTP--glucose-1-phosphate uridylyltransferase
MKGVIVAAGYGSRFLPVTKTVPKEMLPLIDKPSIDFIVDEFLASGIKQILIVTSRRKKALEDYFDREPELEAVFSAQNDLQKLEKIRPSEAEFFFVRQRQMMGTGHALLQARAFLGNDPFVVAYPDDIHFGNKPLSLQLIEKYRQTGCSVLATLHDPPDIGRYAVLSLDDDNLHVLDMVEKPAPGTELSKEASIGRYLYSEGFLDALAEGWPKHKGSGEFHHVYGLKKQMENKKVVFKRIEGERFDTGAPDGYLRALLHYASGIPELKVILDEELKKIADSGNR